MSVFTRSVLSQVITRSLPPEFVRYLVSEVQLVGMADQSAPEAEAQLTLQEPDGTVDESCRNCDEEPLRELQHEGLRILLNNALHYQTWETNTIDYYCLLP